MSEQDVLKFCEITGASPEEARNFLQIADNNFETAVTLYLENGGGAVSSSSGTRHSTNEEHLDRQLQDTNVRAPIAAKTDILVGGEPYFHTAISRPRRHNGTVRPSVFNQGDSTTGSSPDFMSRLQAAGALPSHRSSIGSPSDPVENAISAKAKRLADLFRPPFDIMFRGTFEEAREAAKENGKWLLINIQDPTEFACQILNRDVWSDNFIKDIIRESFIFLQYNNESPDGVRYSTFYQVHHYPHVGIIDALTGERLKLWEKQLTLADFTMEVTEFLEQQQPSEFLESIRAAKRVKTSKNISDMSEEEQLKAAIAASLNGSSSETSSAAVANVETKESTPPAQSPYNLEESDEESKKDEEEAGSTFDAIKPIKRDEPTDIANSTRIQLRMGDGSRIIRRFLKTDPVRHLFEFVKAEFPDAKNQPFELVFNRTQLIDVVDQTVLEAGLSNAAVNCVFV